jgi:hypothetical protein
MKMKIIAVISLVAISGINLYSQITEAEAALRIHSADTIVGWKKGGVLTATIAQTSLTNWAAGGARILSH